MKTRARKTTTRFIPLLILLLTVPAGLYLSIQWQVGRADTCWIEDFGYRQEEIHKLSFNRRGKRSCPQITVMAGSSYFPIIFDTGCGTGISFTNAAEGKIDYTVLSRIESLYRDGSHRGWSDYVRINKISVFDEEFQNITTTLSDWTMFSSHKFYGIIGLQYFNDKVVTLDYKARKIAVTDRPLNYTNLGPDKYTILPLHQTNTPGQKYLPFFMAELDDQPVMVYLDTGKNHSYIYNPDSRHSILQKPGNFINRSIKVGGLEWILQDITEVHDMAQAAGLPYPTRVELNSDQLWKLGLVVTFDMQEDKIIFRKQQLHDNSKTYTNAGSLFITSCRMGQFLRKTPGKCRIPHRRKALNRRPAG